MRNVFAILLICLFFVGCAPSQFTPTRPPDLQFDKTESYTIDLDKIPKPEVLKPIFLDEDMNKIPEEQADQAAYILLVPSEYAKVGALVKLAKTYKSIIKDQEVLINANIDIINSLKEYAELERMKAQAYRDLWVDSENLYRQERYQRKVDNAVNKGAIGAITIGGIIALILLL